MDLVIDRREPWRLVDLIDSRTDHTPVQEHLHTGDIVCKELDAAIERKTLNDAVESTGNGRLFDQVARMNDEYTHSAVIVHGQKIHNIRAEVHGGHSNSVKQVMGSLANLQIQTDSHIMWLPGDTTENQETFGFAQLIEYMERWFGQISNE